MVKKTLIAAATAVALASAVVSSAAPASAATAGVADISWNGGHWNGSNQWNGPNQWNDHKNGGHNNWNRRRACEPIIRWKKVGYRYHRRWQPIVVGWNCGHWGHKGPKGHNDWNWKWR